MKKIVCIFSIMMLTYSNGFCENKIKNDSKKEIILAVTHLPPYRIVRDDKVDGILIEMLNEIIRPMNLKIRPLVAPFKRCLINLKNGSADIYIGLFRSPDGRNIFTLSNHPSRLKQSNHSISERERAIVFRSTKTFTA